MIVVRCRNLAEQPIKLTAGSTASTFTEVEATRVDDRLFEAKEAGPEADRKPAHREVVPGHLRGLYETAKESCSGLEEARKLEGSLTTYSTVFSTGDGDVGWTTLVEHSIPFREGIRPIRPPPRRLGPEKEAETDRQAQDSLRRGIIELAEGVWISQVILVKKKDRKWKFCMDFRRLNAVTQQDAYPLPRIDDSLDALAGSRYFSTLDLVSGYWQVPLMLMPRKTFCDPLKTVEVEKVLPFGLRSVPATFQRLMECGRVHYYIRMTLLPLH